MAYVLFDFDGTLCDSFDLYLDFYNQYLKRKKRDTVTKAEIRQMGVLGIATRENIPRWQIFWLLILARRYVSHIINKLAPFPGLEAELKKLKMKHTLGIVTSNSKGNVEKFLKNHELTHYFSFIESKSSYFGKAKKLAYVLKKYNIPPTQCVYVGDETRDTVAAHTVSIKAAAVTWGLENGSVIAKSQPDISITKVSDLYKSVSTLLSNNK